MELSFVDTSAWVSMADSAEATHARVAAALEDRRGRLLTTDHVLQETWMVMRHRHDRFAAETLVNAIRRGIAGRVSCGHWKWREMGATSALDFSSRDRTSWAVMSAWHHPSDLTRPRFPGLPVRPRTTQSPPNRALTPISALRRQYAPATSGGAWDAEYLHDLVAEMVDDLHGDVAGFGGREWT